MRSLFSRIAVMLGNIHIGGAGYGIAAIRCSQSMRCILGANRFARGGGHNHDLVHACALERGQDMAQQGQACHLVQHLGQRGFHPCALTGSEDNGGLRHERFR